MTRWHSRCRPMTVRGKSRAEIAALQVFLDREGFSPGGDRRQDGLERQPRPLKPAAGNGWKRSIRTIPKGHSSSGWRFQRGLRLRPTRSPRRMRPALCRLHSGRLRPQGAVAASVVHVRDGNARPKVPHGRGLSARAQSRCRFFDPRHDDQGRQSRPNKKGKVARIVADKAASRCSPTTRRGNYRRLSGHHRLLRHARHLPGRWHVGAYRLRSRLYL